MQSIETSAIATGRGGLKCVVWDLDETMWSGTLLEGGTCTLNIGVEATIRTLDERGILQSIASKNDYEVAWARLEALGIADIFLFPQIGWWSKAKSIEAIADGLGIGLDAVAFIDDQAAERHEVAHFLPQVTLIDATDIPLLLEDRRLMPRFVTAESCQRRSMYTADLQRKTAEDRFAGSRDAFLATLAMRMTIRRATEVDLERAEELTVRTNQLNTTGRTYSHTELAALIGSDDHVVLVAQLEDRFGNSGAIGLALVETGPAGWILRLLIMSCRVISRGIGTVMLAHLLQWSRREGVTLRAAFIPTDRNRQMYVTLKFAGFRLIGEVNGEMLLESDPIRAPAVPAYVEVVSDLLERDAA